LDANRLKRFCNSVALRESLLLLTQRLHSSPMENRPTDRKQKAKGKQKTANKTKLTAAHWQFSFLFFLFSVCFPFVGRFLIRWAII
jgi:hypothetical protein